MTILGLQLILQSYTQEIIEKYTLRNNFAKY